MEIRKYGKKRPDVTELLLSKGALSQPPIQIRRDDLEYDDGVDIIYRLKGMTPQKFAEYADMLLLAAYTEGQRYKGERYRFAKFEVELNRTTKGRETISPRRTYIASKNEDSDIMVYGEEVLGELPEEITKKPFLINRVQEILDMPDTPSPGAYVQKQRPYKVLTMVISIRGGLKKSEVAARREEREKQ